MSKRKPVIKPVTDPEATLFIYQQKRKPFRSIAVHSVQARLGVDVKTWRYVGTMDPATWITALLNADAVGRDIMVEGFWK